MNEVAFWFWEGLFMDWMIGKGTNKTHKAVIFQTFDVEWILEVIFPLQVILSIIVS